MAKKKGASATNSSKGIPRGYPDRALDAIRVFCKLMKDAESGKPVAVKRLEKRQMDLARTLAPWAPKAGLFALKQIYGFKVPTCDISINTHPDDKDAWCVSVHAQFAIVPLVIGRGKH